MEAAVRTKREDLVQAAKKLMCQRGYEAVSPRDLLDESGAGQGSFYHHFRGKQELAMAALEEVASEMQASAHAILEAGPTPLKSVNAYLGLPRDGLKGCRMGRFANEASIVDTPLRAPIENYFRDLQATLADALRAAQGAGELANHLDAEELALTLIAVIQGGFVLSRIYRDRNAVRRATDTAAKMLGMLAPA
jgi:TetR/AcrR family transcriptional repressor of nem operon